jgi:hypothetical protein
VNIFLNRVHEPNGRAEANHLGTDRGIEWERNIQTPTAGVRFGFVRKPSPYE